MIRPYTQIAKFKSQCQICHKDINVGEKMKPFHTGDDWRLWCHEGCFHTARYKEKGDNQSSLF